MNYWLKEIDEISPSGAGTTWRPPTPTPTPTRKATPPTTTEGPLKRCPGVCLPGLMGAFCSKPAVIINYPANLCDRGSVCCDSKPRQGNDAAQAQPQQAKPSGRPTSALQDILSNPLTSLLAGPIISNLAGSFQKKPSPAPYYGQFVTLFKKKFISMIQNQTVSTNFVLNSIVWMILITSLNVIKFFQF